MVQFIQLKEVLKSKFYSIIVIVGDDNYLSFSSVKTVEENLNIQFPELNRIDFNENYSLDDILAAVNVLPFMSDKRVVLVREFYPTDSDMLKLNKYSILPNNDSVLVFINSKKGNVDKLNEALVVNCDKLEANLIFKWISAKVKLAKKEISQSNIKMIAEYCNNDMARVSTEVDKLISVSEQEITTEEIETLVSKDIEYVSFALANAITDKNIELAMSILEKLLIKKDDCLMHFGSIYGIFRRMFFVSISSSNLKELSTLLNVKEYAIIKTKEACAKSSPKKLKKAIDICAKTDYDIKNNIVKHSDALKMLVLELLNL